MKSESVAQSASLISLRRRWGCAAFLFVLLLWLGYQLLRTQWDLTFAWRWAVLAGGVLAYQLSLLWRGLEDNHRRGEARLLPTLGAGNVLTMLRGLLLGLLAGFLLVPWPSGSLAWLPALLYTLAIVADYFDGYLARITHHTTVLGETLDIEFDALGILIATSLAVHYGQLPWWYLLLGLSRYLFLFGIWWRRRRGKPLYDLPPSIHRRIVAGFQMGFNSVMLWPMVYPPATTLAGVVFAVPFTLSFIRDWLVVSGRLDADSSSYVDTKRRVTVVFTRWLPVLLRIGAVAVMIGVVFPTLWTGPGRVEFFAWPRAPFPRLTATAFSLLILVATLMVALGAAGRLAALGLLIATSANILVRGLHSHNGFLLVTTIALMLLGSGAFSCWRPEDAILKRRAGEGQGA